MRFSFLVLFVFLTSTIYSQIGLDKLKDLSNKAQDIINNKELSESDIITGLKEALVVGTKNSVSIASSKGGFNNNFAIKISFPEDANKMKSTLIGLGLKSQVDHFEFVLNEAAEDASIFAKDIFIDVVKQMNIRDAKNILTGHKHAATTYLKEHSFMDLYVIFKPVVKKSIEEVELAKHWQVLSTRYNKIPLTKNINTDLEDYVTRKAIDGLFVLISKEEENIRNNPKARVSEILQKVFK